LNAFRELLVAVVALAVAAAAALVPAEHHSRTYWTGVLQANQADYSSFAGAGINRVTLELRWDAYEPSQGTFSSSYIAEQQADVEAARHAGLQVVLDPGLHFPASWVFGLSGQTHFVDQYGDTWSGGDGSNPANAVFDPSVRRAEATYLARIGRDFAGDFVAVRAGGLLTGELRLPDGHDPGDPDGHPDKLWMYDTTAQQAAPVRGWKPGSGTRAQARASIAYYLSSMDGYVKWLLTNLSGDFPLTELQLLEPGWGIRPGQVTAAINAGLTGTTPVEAGNTLQADLDYAGEVAVASTFENTVVYTTWLDAPPSGPGVAGEAPVEYLHALAQQYSLPLAGENTGKFQTTADLQTCITRVSQLGMQGFMWFTGSSLVNDEGLSLTQFKDATG
jgi:hypothetical protein